MAIGKAISPMFRRKLGSYGAYTTVWYAQVLANGGTATSTELAALTVFENALGSDIAEFDRLVITGLSNTVAKKISLVNPTSTIASFVGSPSESNNGVEFNGTTQYIDTNYNLSTSSSKFTRNSASAGVYVRKSIGSQNSLYMGAVQTNFVYLSPNYTPVGGALMDINAGSNTIGAAQTTTGLFSVVRTGASAHAGFRNGTSFVSGIIASAALISRNLYVGCRNNAGTADLFSTQQVSLYYMGSSVINQSTLYTAVQALGTTLGWAI